MSQHALQELEQLTAETAQMEKEKQILESVLSDSRVERDSVRCFNTVFLLIVIFRELL